MVTTHDGYHAKLYVNGALKAETEFIDSHHFQWPLRLQPVDIGIEGNRNSRVCFSGILDDVLVYRRNLNQEEVEALSRKGEEVEKTILDPGKTAIRDEAIKAYEAHEIWKKQTGEQLRAKIPGAALGRKSEVEESGKWGGLHNSLQ